MNVRWKNVWLILRRELLDQARDHRTLFMIFVLPVLLYPLLGIGVAQLTSAFAMKARRVVVVGAEFLPQSEPAHAARGIVCGAAALTPPPRPQAPQLLVAEGTRFNANLFDNPDDADTLTVELADYGPPWTDEKRRRELLRDGATDAIVLIPPDIARILGSQRGAGIPIAYNSADERSQLTYLRVDRVLKRWNEVLRELRARQEGKPEGYSEPVRALASDVARDEETGGAVWAKIFPFLLVLMALTGAFYPSVDLCAGEKERGTMETLLISPASRAEIVLGKFLTVMVASNLMALLNLASMGATAWSLASQLQGARMPARGGGAFAVGHLLSAPSWTSAGWMILLLIPLSAFFSALCVALAVQARSMKEGQYYMTPVYMIALPLAFMALVPGVELDLFTSLLPVTGVSLLLRALMQGDYDLARRFFLPVLVPVVIYGLVALRWAVDQFRSESVLFRGAERFDLRGWLRHVLRDKTALPTPGQALLCFVLILVAAFWVSSRLPASIWTTVAVQVIAILGIPLLMATVLTTNPGRTLRFRGARPTDMALGILLPVALFPLVCEMRPWVEFLYPTPKAIATAVAKLQSMIPSLRVAFIIFAVAPAICEEVAFRGYILSGLERAYRTSYAIILSALLFGFLHVLLSLFNQLFNATLLGLVLGLLAVRSRSIFPGIAFHLVNNSLVIGLSVVAQNPDQPWDGLAHLLLRDRAKGLFQLPLLAVGCLLAVGMLYGLIRRGKGIHAARQSRKPYDSSARLHPARHEVRAQGPQA